MLFMLAFMLLLFWGVSRLSRSQQRKMQAEQERRTDEALVPGNWVRTRAGFYGTVVEVSGDVVTLATPLGDESLWARSAIVDAEEPPFATESDDSGEDAVTEAWGIASRISTRFPLARKLGSIKTLAESFLCLIRASTVSWTDKPAGASILSPVTSSEQMGGCSKRSGRTSSSGLTAYARGRRGATESISIHISSR